MEKTCFVSIDVEKDLEKDSFNGVENLDKILSIFKKHGVSTTLFVLGEVLSRYPDKFKKLASSSKNPTSPKFEIASHSFSHKFWSELSKDERGKELEWFLNLYKEIFDFSDSGMPLGFRAPSHLMDTRGIELLQDAGFKYDSSVVPHYPFFTKYRGYQGQAPKKPYYPSQADCRRKGVMIVLEIPCAGHIFGIPLAGTWIRKLPFFVYQGLFALKKPEFLSLVLHSWDSLDDKTLLKLEKILVLLKKMGYKFLNGKQIYEQFSQNRQ